MSRSGNNLLNNPINLVWLVIGIAIMVSVLTSLLPTLTSSFDTLQTCATQINNPLVRAIAPVLPLLVGVGLLMLILMPVFVLIKKAPK